jgi:hypothetical protein
MFCSSLDFNSDLIHDLGNDAVLCRGVAMNQEIHESQQQSRVSTKTTRFRSFKQCSEGYIVQSEIQRK